MPSPVLHSDDFFGFKLTLNFRTSLFPKMATSQSVVCLNMFDIFSHKNYFTTFTLFLYFDNTSYVEYLIFKTYLISKCFIRNFFRLITKISSVLCNTKITCICALLNAFSRIFAEIFPLYYSNCAFNICRAECFVAVSNFMPYFET